MDLPNANGTGSVTHYQSMALVALPNASGTGSVVALVAHGFHELIILITLTYAIDNMLKQVMKVIWL